MTRRDTDAVRAGLNRSNFDETAEAMFLTSGYVYESAAQAEASFAGEVDHFIYSRFGNPTVEAFQDRLRVLEGAEACYATASGMAAVFASLIAQLDQGDRVVASRALFGSCTFILAEILPRWGITTEFIDGRDLDEWQRALSTPTKAVFFESPSNPMQELVDVVAVAELGHRVGATVIVDNVFATPVGQRPLEFGADIVVYSTTKHIDGQGRTLGGAVLGTTEFVTEKLQPIMRHTGPAMSPFTAWVLIKSLETLDLRVRRHSESALHVAEHLSDTPGVSSVWYPLLQSHPQFELAQRQMSLGGSVVTLELDGGKDAAFRFLDALEIFDISNNLGDSKSLATHPATTTHRRLGPEGRAEVGITDGVVRLSIGLEDLGDLIEDVDRALAGG